MGAASRCCFDDKLVDRCTAQPFGIIDVGAFFILGKRAPGFFFITVNLPNCTFENNDSTYDGGAIYTETLNEPLIKDCTFKNNKANNGVGGAIAADAPVVSGSKLKVIGGLFEGNVSTKMSRDPNFKTIDDLKKGAGGAIRLFHIDSNNVIKNCKFTNNSGRGANVFVQYGHGLGDKLTKEWGNTGEGMYVVIK